MDRELLDLDSLGQKTLVKMVPRACTGRPSFPMGANDEDVLKYTATAHPKRVATNRYNIHHRASPRPQRAARPVDAPPW